jgi:hypothetical protein
MRGGSGDASAISVDPHADTVIVSSPLEGMTEQQREQTSEA